MIEPSVLVKIDRNMFDNFTQKWPVSSISIENVEIFQIRIQFIVTDIVYK